MQPQRPQLSQAQCSRENPKLLQHSNIITVRKSFYSPKILQCMYPNITVLKYYSPQATLLQVQAAIKQLQLTSSQTYTCINIY